MRPNPDYSMTDEADGLTVFGHVGKPDQSLHELGQHELTVIVEGPQGYVSPGWYGFSPAVPTWIASRPSAR